MNCICEHYVTCDMYIESCMILVVCWLNRDPFVVLDGLPGYMGSSIVTPQVFGFHICTAFHEHEHHASIREPISHEA